MRKRIIMVEIVSGNSPVVQQCFVCGNEISISVEGAAMTSGLELHVKGLSSNCDVELYHDQDDFSVMNTIDTARTTTSGTTP